VVGLWRACAARREGGRGLYIHWHTGTRMTHCGLLPVHRCSGMHGMPARGRRRRVGSNASHVTTGGPMQRCLSGGVSSMCILAALLQVCMCPEPSLPTRQDNVTSEPDNLWATPSPGSQGSRRPLSRRNRAPTTTTTTPHHHRAYLNLLHSHLFTNGLMSELGASTVGTSMGCQRLEQPSSDVV
jgi:hypothetical protein